MFLLKRNGIYYLEYLDEEENRVRRISTKQRIKREAIKFLSDFESNSKTRKIFNHILLDDFEKKYSEHVKINLSNKYYLNVKLSFKQLMEHTGNVPISKLGYPLFEKFFTETFSRTKQGAVTYYRILKSAFNKAVQWEYLTENPIVKIKLPKIPQNHPSFLSEIELQIILGKEKNTLLKDIYSLAFNTGMRITEIVYLKWDQISFEERNIRVMNTEEFTTKGKRERIIPMNERVFSILQKMIPKIIVMQKSNYVFIKNRRRFNSEYISKSFKEAIKEAAKENLIDTKIHFHDLRHSFASNLAQKGVSLYVIKELLGHTDIKTTMIYAHLKPENLRNAVELLN